MNTKYLIFNNILFLLILLSGCGKDKEDTLNDLKDEMKEIQGIEARSGDMTSEEDAFNVLSDLNQSLKRVRDACLTLDDEYGETQDVAAKEQMEREFSRINDQIDQSLHAISRNLEPYKKKEEISRMLKKLHGLMISR
jgi:DNA repair ATPase RecN